MVNVRRVLMRFYWSLERVIVPTLKHSQAFYEDFLKSYVVPDIKWLELGCGRHILPPWSSKSEKYLVKNCKMVVGIDYDYLSLKQNNNILLKARCNISNIPFQDHVFDLITSNMVVEHLGNPEVQFSEISRVLKPNGFFIFHTPTDLGYVTLISRLIPDIIKKMFIYILQRRKEEDVFKTNYRVNNKRRIQELAQRNGFEIKEIKMVNSSAQFAVVPPLALFELIWIKILMLDTFKSFRPYIIAILEKHA